MTRSLKKEIMYILEEDYPVFLTKLLDNPPEKTINVLFSLLLSKSDKIKWHSVVGFGAVVKKIAEKNIEKARTIMRRCMWMLNDESGGIGWGIPESMAESMANHKQLFEEYHKIFLSYLFERKEGDNFLEFLPLRRGGFWGLAKLCNVYKDVFVKMDVFYMLQDVIKFEQDDYIKIYIWLAVKALDKDFCFSIKLKEPLKIFWNNKFFIVNENNLGDLL